MVACICVTRRLLAQKQSLQQQVGQLRAAADNERRVQQQYEASVASFMQDRGLRTQELKDRAEQVGFSVHSQRRWSDQPFYLTSCESQRQQSLLLHLSPCHLLAAEPAQPAVTTSGPDPAVLC